MRRGVRRRLLPVLRHAVHRRGLPGRVQPVGVHARGGLQLRPRPQQLPAQLCMGIWVHVGVPGRVGTDQGRLTALGSVFLRLCRVQELLSLGVTSIFSGRNREIL